MSLSNELISQFVKLTKDDKKVQNEVTVYGTVVKNDGKNYVKIDGSETLTPVNTTTNIVDGERVTLMIKDHTAIVTGNISSPAARDNDVKDAVNQITEFEILIGDTIDAQNGKIDNLVVDNINIKEKLTAVEAEIETVTADNVTINEKLTANEAEIKDLKVKKLDAETANLTFATIDNLKATEIEVNKIEGNFAEFSQLTTEQFKAQEAVINNLKTTKLDASEAEIKYANIDFANIGIAAVEKLFAESGIIKDLVVGDTSITGELVGVTIKGDLIEAETLVADKLVVKGSDGLYYKLNTDGVSIEAEQTEYNSLNGSIITAKSITATKISVDDLVAFDATIGGFNLTSNSIYSGAKVSVDNTTKGIYMDNTGQVAFGDSSNYIKFFKDADSKWKLAISANNIKLSASNKDIETVINDIDNKVQKTVKNIVTHYAISNSPTIKPTTGWSTTSPTWVDGKYIWSKNITTFADNTTSETEPVCITGGKGPSGTAGAEGQGIQSITSEYYLSTSKTTQTGGSWVDTPPVWVNGKYMWTRSKVVYKNPTSTEYTTPICDSSWEVVNDLEFGGRNFISNSDFYKDLSGWAFSLNNGTVTINNLNTVPNKKYCRIERSNDTQSYRVYIRKDLENLKVTKGDIITLSAMVRSINLDPISDKTQMTLRVPGGSGIDYCISPINTNGEWRRVYATSVIGDEVTSPTIPSVYILLYRNGIVDVTDIKVEKGNKVSDWTPALEDTDEKIENIKIGGRNLALGTSSEYTEPFTNFDGGTNRTVTIGKVLTDGLSIGDTISIRLVYKYDNIVPATNKTASCYIQGYGTSTGWNPGYFERSPVFNLNGSGEHEFIYRGIITEEHLKNKFWTTSIRHDNILSGSVQWKMFKVENGNKNTDWSQAPEDADLKFATKAELSTTENSIIGGVNKTLKGYVENSTFEQKSNEIVASFKSSGGLNLIRNSTGYNGTKLWRNPSGGTMGTRSRNDIGGATSSYLYLDNGNSIEKSHAYCARFKLKSDTKYTLSGWFHNYVDSPSMDVFVLTSTSLGENSDSLAYSSAINLISQVNTKSKWTKFSVSFTTPVGTVSGIIRIDNRGYSAGSTIGKNIIHWSALMLNEGEETPWTPHPSETYDGSTTIDATGVTIRNGALTIKNEEDVDMLKGENGNLLLNGGTLTIENMRGGIKDTVRFIGGNMGPGIVFESINPNTGTSQSTASISLNPNDVGIMDIFAESVSLRSANGSGNLNLGRLRCSTINNTDDITTNGSIILDQGTNERQIRWLSAGRYNRTCGFYGGTDTSNTTVGMYDWSSGVSVWTYNTDTTLSINRLLYLNGGLTQTGGESRFSSGQYVDPLPGVACSMKVTGQIASNTMRSQSYGFLETKAQITSRSGAGGGFDFWTNGPSGNRFVFDGDNMKLYKVVNGVWTIIAG